MEISVIVKFLSSLVQTVITLVVRITLAILTYYITVFVVSTGAGLAGHDPSGDFVVLSASRLGIDPLLGEITLR